MPCVLRRSARRVRGLQIVRSGEMRPEPFFLVLDFSLSMHHMNGVGLDCSRPAIPRHPAQALHLARLPGPRAVGGMRIFSTFIVGRRRKLRRSGHSTAARSAAKQSSVVSLPLEMRNVLRKHCRPFRGRRVNARSVALASFHRDGRRNSGCLSRGAGHATRRSQGVSFERRIMLRVAVTVIARRTHSSSPAHVT